MQNVLHLFFVSFLCTLWFGYAHQPSAMQWSRSVRENMKLPFGSVAERSRSTGYKLVSCGQKSTKICSNRSNRIFCLICCCLFDFSRSDYLFHAGHWAIAEMRHSFFSLSLRLHCIALSGQKKIKNTAHVVRQAHQPSVVEPSRSAEYLHAKNWIFIQCCGGYHVNVF